MRWRWLVWLMVTWPTWGSCMGPRMRVAELRWWRSVVVRKWRWWFMVRRRTWLVQGMGWLVVVRRRRWPLVVVVWIRWWWWMVVHLLLLFLDFSVVELIALLCEDEDDETRGAAPIVDLSSSGGVLARDGSSAEVWKLSGETTVVSRTSEASLLPRLATWKKSEDVAEKILYSIECVMRRCPYTLGLGEPNLSGKPSLDYDLVCKPSELHSLKRSPSDLMNLENHENRTVYTTQQILESWICVSQQLLKRIGERIDSKDFERASSDCWILERIWKLLSEIEDVHLLMDPDDFLRLKNQLSIKASSESEAFCFRSRGLIEITKQSKDLKHKVPYILGVEVDPMGGPRIQEAAMKLYRKKLGFERIHLLQALQAIESALKKFYYSYKQLIVTVMGSLEAKANRSFVTVDSSDSLSEIFLEPTYFPSLDAAKTFLGDYWSQEHGRNGSIAKK